MRERLLRTADDLFYREGIHVVGIDRILGEAGVAKASLYDTFGSKDELVRAYLEERSSWLQERIEARVQSAGSARERVLAAFDEFADRVHEGGTYCGCPFIRACAEGGDQPSAARDVSTAHRRWQRELFTRLATDVGIEDPDNFSRQLGIIYDGATIAVAMECQPAAALAARAVVERLLGKARARTATPRAAAKPRSQPAARKKK